MSFGVKMRWERTDGQVWEGIRVFRFEITAKVYADYWKSLGTNVLGIEETDLAPGDNRAERVK